MKVMETVPHVTADDDGGLASGRIGALYLVTIRIDSGHEVDRTAVSRPGQVGLRPVDGKAIEGSQSVLVADAPGGVALKILDPKLVMPGFRRPGVGEPFPSGRERGE